MRLPSVSAPATALFIAALVGPAAGAGRSETIDLGVFAVNADHHTGRDSANLAGLGLNFFFGYSGSFGWWYRDRVCVDDGPRLCGDASGLVSMGGTKVDWQSTVNDWIANWTDFWKGHNAWGLLVAAENKGVYHPSYYPFTQHVCRKIHERNPELRTMGQGSIIENPNTGYIHFPEIFDSCPDLDVLGFSHYWFKGNTPYSDQKALQTFADYSARCNQKMRHPHNLRRPRPMEWYAIIQAHEEFRQAPPWPTVPDSLRGKSYRVFRRPSAEEIRCQAFLSLAYGAKGIIYYVFHSDTVPGAGRVGPDPADRFHYMYYKDLRSVGLVDGSPNRHPYDRSHHPDDTTYDAVRRLNADLKIMGPVFWGLRWDSAVSISPARPFRGLGFITGFACPGRDSASFELATFTDRAGAGYCLLVNRQCLSADTCRVAVSIGGRYRGRTIRVTDQRTQATLPVPEGKYLTAAIAPGDGRLFKVEAR